MMTASILWRRLDTAGHEAARLKARPDGWELDGSAVFSDAGQPCRLNYWIRCDTEWRTRAARVSGWVGEKTVGLDLIADNARRWLLNGREQPAVAGCMDLDLNFSPVTNLLPVRRLVLAVGQSARVKAAWLRFPELTLESLEQVYHRVGPGTYRYESGGGSFSADLEVNEAGFITHYPGLWAEG